MKRPLNNNTAFTLVEMLCYMALLGLVLSVIYSVFYQFSRTLSAADRTMIRERSVFRAVRVMQEDIRRSKKMLESFGPVRSSDGVLILQTGPTGDVNDQIVIYTLGEAKNTLLRYQAEAGELPQEISATTLVRDVEGFTFAFDGDSGKLLKVTMAVKKGAFGVLRNRPLTFYAMMRNGKTGE